MRKGTVLIVDGYNIIYAWPELIQLKDRSLAEARQALIDIMINFSGYSGYQVYIVFDGQGAETTVEPSGGITVCYTRTGDTADQYIERLAGDGAFAKQEVYVATSDYDEQRTILGRGAHRMSGRELHLQVEKMRRDFDRRKEIKESERGTLASRLGAEIRSALEKMRRSK